VAEFSSSDSPRSCKLCEQLSKQKSFKKGSRVRIAGVFDCENCPVWKAKPIKENEIIVFLYNQIPFRFNSISGQVEFSAEDVKFLFEVYGIHKDLWEDYYNRLMYLNREVNIAHKKQTEAINKKRKEDEEWKRLKKASSKNVVEKVMR